MPLLTTSPRQRCRRVHAAAVPCRRNRGFRPSMRCGGRYANPGRDNAGWEVPKLRGRGPVLLEAVTYRYYGHSASDNATAYRTPEEEEAWKREDPIPRFVADLTHPGLLRPGEAEALAQRVRRDVEEAMVRAARTADPDPAHIEDGVYADSTSEEISPAWHTSVYHRDRVRALTRDTEGNILFRHPILEALTEEMIRDRRVILYGEEIADYGGAYLSCRPWTRSPTRRRRSATCLAPRPLCRWSSAPPSEAARAMQGSTRKVWRRC